MAKTNVFTQVKNVNLLVDEMESLDPKSTEYANLEDCLYWMLETLDMDLRKCKNLSLQLSKKTGHYWLKKS